MFCDRVVLEDAFLFAFGSEEEERFLVCLCSVGRDCLRSVGGKFVTGFEEGAMLCGCGAGVMLCGCGVVSVARGPVWCVGFRGGGVSGVRVAGRRVVALGSGRGGFPARVGPDACIIFMDTYSILKKRYSPCQVVLRKLSTTIQLFANNCSRPGGKLKHI